MTDPLFTSLLDKWLTGTITEVETRAFFGMLERPDCQDQLLEQISGDLVQQIYLEAEDHARRERIRDGVWLEITRLRDPVLAPIRSLWRPRTWYAAAVILLLLGTAIVFLSRPHASTARLTTPSTLNDLAPGGNKATLTLAGGQQIMLDSAHTGRLASQGGTEIINDSGGSLTYQRLTAPTGNAQVQYNTLTTPRGGQYQLILPDGSHVWLDASSSITYPTAFTGKERRVEISGEAYFEVASEPKAPFHVKVNDMDVTVLGTHFNINSYSDESAVRTTLLEGAVRVMKGLQSARLSPGQQYEWSTTSGSARVLDNVDLDAVIAWKNGLFHFGNSSLQDVMRQVSRWYDVEVEYRGAVGPRMFGGEISRNSNVSEVLKILELSKVHFKMEGRKIIVMP